MQDETMDRVVEFLRRQADWPIGVSIREVQSTRIPLYSIPESLMGTNGEALMRYSDEARSLQSRARFMPEMLDQLNRAVAVMGRLSAMCARDLPRGTLAVVYKDIPDFRALPMYVRNVAECMTVLGVGSLRQSPAKMLPQREQERKRVQTVIQGMARFADQYSAAVGLIQIATPTSAPKPPATVADLNAYRTQRNLSKFTHT